MNDDPSKSGAPVAVVFDVDGTLYWQKGLRRRMLLDLLASAILSSRTRLDIRILKRFREDRELLAKRTVSGFAEAQYQIPAEALGISSARVEEAVDRWIYKRPLRYLKRYRVEGIAEWLEQLRAGGVRLGVYSEYPADEKLAALDLTFDAVVASTDPEVDAFKPDPKGLEVVMERLGSIPSTTLFVGDRNDRDRPCAQAVRASFLLVGRESKHAISSFPPPQDYLPDFLTPHLTPE